MTGKAVVLLSGGLDSATTLYYARRHGWESLCLTFDYGQRHKREIHCAEFIARSASSTWQLIKINLPWKGSSLLDKKINVPRAAGALVPFGEATFRSAQHWSTQAIPNTYVPARNIIFLSFALSYAEAAGAGAIFIGAHAQDYSGYPDCRPEFFRAFRKVISCGTKVGIEKKKIFILTPLLNKHKRDIIKLGVRLGVPFAHTVSCYRGGKRPCGKCESCLYRAKGFSEAGISDPAT